MSLGWHPSRPRIVSTSAHSAHLEWRVPEIGQPIGYEISAQLGGSTSWRVLVPNTHATRGSHVVEDLMPETWYVFRVSPIHDDDAGYVPGYGSAPSKPAQTRPRDPFAIQVRRTAAGGGGHDGANMVGINAAAATVVARRAETTPPLTAEEGQFASLAAVHTLEAARLRKELLTWDQVFEEARLEEISA